LSSAYIKRPKPSKGTSSFLVKSKEYKGFTITSIDASSHHTFSDDVVKVYKIFFVFKGAVELNRNCSQMGEDSELLSKLKPCELDLSIFPSES
jgi:hypothetical protein